MGAVRVMAGGCEKVIAARPLLLGQIHELVAEHPKRIELLRMLDFFVI